MIVIVLLVAVFVLTARVVMRMICMIVNMLMAFIAVVIRIGLVMPGIKGLGVSVFTMLVIVRLGRLLRFESFRVDDLALQSLAIAAAARIAMTRTAVAAGAVFGFFFRLAMRA